MADYRGPGLEAAVRQEDVAGNRHRFRIGLGSDPVVRGVERALDHHPLDEGMRGHP